MKNTLFVIDVYNLIYRMFYAIPEMTTRSGKPVNAIFGVAKFLKVLAEENPDALMLVATDVGQSFRANLYSEYKGTRERMPDNLRSQIEDIFALFRAAGIEILALDGYEADDIIGSLAHQHEDNSYQIVIISSDKDLCQFVRDGHVHIYDAMKRKFMKEADVLEKFLIPPHQVRDYLAIVGDTSDNIPGISGFGPKKAVDLLHKYGTLENIYAHAHELSETMRGILERERENAFLSQKLASITTTLPPITTPVGPFAPGLQNDTYRKLLTDFEFRSLIAGGQKPDNKIERTIEVTSIDDMSQLEGILKNMCQPGEKVFLSVEHDGKIFFGYRETIYSLDERGVDVSLFIDSIFAADIEIIGYDLKADIKKLLSHKQKLLQNTSEEQNRLF